MSNNQDWEPVILINKKKMKEREKNDNSNKVAKPVSNNNKLTGSGKKINDDDELPTQTLVGKDTSLMIMKARTTKGLKQKDVAIKMNMPLPLYQQYENGTAVRNGQMLNKLGKVLGVKLTGKGVA